MSQYTTQQKFIAYSLVVVIFIGGLFFYFHSKRNKIVENKITSTTNQVTQKPETIVPVQVPVSKTITKAIVVKPVVALPVPIGTDQFVISLADTPTSIANNLSGDEYIQDVTAFANMIGTKTIIPGAYKISKEMTPAQLLQVISGKPYMKWIVIPPGLRKEEIATLLASTLDWNKKQTAEWITKDTTIKPEYTEGVYSSDTYLIPVDEKPADVAIRLINKFNEKFVEYLPQFTAKNIKWTTALTLASIVQREASNFSDMPLIAGIIWNRLNQGMMLDVDSTLQYVRGNKGQGWWAPITIADKKIDSPYNTYMHTGLPPHPISNPSTSAINAVLNPAVTDCLYYLHDKNHVTHCSTTYEEHIANINTYLKTSAN